MEVSHNTLVLPLPMNMPLPATQCCSGFITFLVLMALDHGIGLWGNNPAALDHVREGID
jgi:hypothetical protein